MYDLEKEPTGEVFQGLLMYGLKHCTHMLLVCRHDLGLSAHAEDTLRVLEPHCDLVSESSEWPGTTLIGRTATVRRYRLSPEVIRTVCAAADGLYDWHQPNLPEDLCLLKADGTPWLVSISHERDFFLHTPIGQGRLRSSTADGPVAPKHMEEGSEMKRISVDCNFNWLGPSKPSLTHAKVARWELQAGEQVLALQDDDEWLGVVVFDPSLPNQYQWYIDLD